jgi:hypothetical protein
MRDCTQFGRSLIKIRNNKGPKTALNVTPSRTPILQDYILKGHKLRSEASSKYLGVELQSDMSWRSHIDKTVKKATSTLGFLRRNLTVSNQDTKAAAYKTLVRPTIEYCSSVWSPHTKDAINKIEIVQRRAARYVTNRYRNTSSVTSMLGDLEWDTLETRRKKIRLTMMYNHTDEQYSIVGRTKVLYAAVFVSWLLTFRFLLKNPRVLFAFLTVLSI